MAYFEADQSSSNSEISGRVFFEAGNERNSGSGNGDSSSYRDADVDDDIFSLSNHSKSSSPNSYLETSNSDCQDDAKNGKSQISRNVSHRNDTPISKIDNGAVRSLFRTPSNFGTTQMASPILSTFHLSSSVHPNNSNITRNGTPTSYGSSSKVTPSRLKPKRDDPLVLLHLNVMPLNYTYSCLMSSTDLPDSLQKVRENWRLLQDKLGDTVIERGVLLAHPQDSYETLEERLLEALELPVYPRARILKCGHYVGASESESSSSDEEKMRNSIPRKSQIRKSPGKMWCDICGRNIRLQDYADSGKMERRFCIKIYASNGLMSPCAWAAAWREMERVDVEIEPYVAADLHAELERLVSNAHHLSIEKNEIKFVDEENMTKVAGDHRNEQEKAESFKTETENREQHELGRTYLRVARHKEDCEYEENYENETPNNSKEQSDSRNREMRNQQYDDHKCTKSQAFNQNIRKPSRHSTSRYCNQNQHSPLGLLYTTTRFILQDKRNILVGLLAALSLLLAFFIKKSSIIPAVDNNLSLVNHSLPEEEISSLKLYVPASTIIRETDMDIPTSIVLQEMTMNIQPTSTVTREITVAVPTSTVTREITVDVPTSTVTREITVDVPTSTVTREITLDVPTSTVIREITLDVPTSTVIREITVDVPVSTVTRHIIMDASTSTVIREIAVTQIIPAPPIVIMKDGIIELPETHSIPETRTPDFKREDRKDLQELIVFYPTEDLVNSIY